MPSVAAAAPAVLPASSASCWAVQFEHAPHGLGIRAADLDRPPSPELKIIYDTIVRMLKEDGQELQNALAELRAKATALSDSLGDLEQVERVLRAVETGDVPEIPLPLPASPSEAAVHRKFDGLAKARTALQARKPICPKDLSVLLRAIELRLRDLPSENERPAERRAHLEELEELTRQLGSGDVCADLRLALGSAATWFRAHPQEHVDLPNADAALLKALGTAIAGYRAAFEKKDEPLAQVKTLLEKRGNIGRRASLLSFVRTREPGFRSGNRCELTHGVVAVSRAEGREVDVPWSKVRTEPFEIAFDANLEDIVTPTRANRADKYELQAKSLWRNFDVDLGLVHSGLEQPTYSAVAVSTVQEADAGAGASGTEDDSEPPLVIARTQSEALSGDVAMFVSWLPDRLRRGGFSMGPQIGFGLDDDRPAAFAGVVFSIGRFLNLSGGWSWQEIEDLAPGLAVGDVVTSADDIRRRKDFEDDWYAALTITIDDLPFFGGDDD